MRNLADIHYYMKDIRIDQDDRISYVENLNESELVGMFKHMCEAFGSYDKVDSVEFKRSDYGVIDADVLMEVLSDTRYSEDQRKQFIDIMSLEDMRNILIEQINKLY